MDFFQEIVEDVIIADLIVDVVQAEIAMDYGMGFNAFERQIIREEIIAEELYLAACLPGCMKPCCYRAVCPIGCTGPCCIVVTPVICPPGCMRSCCYRAVCPIGCRKACCVKVVCPVGCTKACCVRTTCPVNCTKVCCVRVACPPGCVKPCCKNNQVLIFQTQKKHLMVWDNDSFWKNPRMVPLTRSVFDYHYINQISKIKCRKKLQSFSNSLYQNQFIMKIVIGYSEYYYASYPFVIEQFFIKIIMAKLHTPNIPTDLKFSGEISGFLYKKSDYLGNWEQRFVTISSVDGLRSYPNQNQAHTMHIRLAKQFWTWFEIFKGKYLIIKIKNVFKTQFAIPLNYLHTWLPAFYSLLRIQQF